MHYTNEQLKEILKCSNEIEYFAENMTISTPFETKKLVLTDAQKL